MQSGDVILSFDGEAIDDTRELVRVVAETQVGRDVEVIVFRDGKEQTLQVGIGRLEEAVLAAAPGAPMDQGVPSETEVLGMTVAAVTGPLSEQFGLEDDARGLVVVGIDEDSDAYEKGMREGDLITEVGQEAISSPADLTKRIEAAEGAGRNSILLLVRREGAPRFVALSLNG
jgi:serine protease Do